MSHISVLLTPVLDLLAPLDHLPARVIDGTVGAGGHSRALLERGAGELLGLDLDPQALQIARETLAPFADRSHTAQNSYASMGIEARKIGWDDGVDAILLDLGVSSMQFDTPERGFAFRYDAPLDMRFDPNGLNATAADLINTLEEEELADLFYQYGEERDSRRIARAVVRARPLTTTQQLASAVEKAMPRRHEDKIHPATRVFQALRIAVNDELETVKQGIQVGLDLLRPQGRMAIISFHSLEDRIVKEAFRLAATDCICPPKTPICICNHKASVQLLTKKPIIADDAEIAHNPRSRSAKLRVIEKL
jgi:16S rRNA (cytosine1402-N4)-methyltransferase